MEILLVPILVLNFFSGILGGFWLAFLGEWKVVALGIGMTVFGSYIVSILLMPSLIFVAPFMANEKLANSLFVALPMTVLSVTYTYLVMGLWAVGTFWSFSNQVHTNAVFPIILWSYSTATAVWSFLAQKDAQSGNSYAGISTFFHQIGCISLMVYTYTNFRHLDFYTMGLWYGAPMVLGLLTQLVLVISTTRVEEI